MSFSAQQLALDLPIAGEEVTVTAGPMLGETGEVFTKRWVVELILDLAGYTSDRDLVALRAVEPSCGVGAFLVPMAERLIESARRHDRSVSDAVGAIRAFDLSLHNVTVSRRTVSELLVMSAGLTEEAAGVLAEKWIRPGDFLLTRHDFGAADFVLGNPPYIRLENVPPRLSAAYRQTCQTMRGRSDVFVGFIELGLKLLGRGGALGFIVADRWMRNQYGAGLRSMIQDGYSVEAIVQLHDVDAFQEQVSAYPAITVISRATQGEAVIADTTSRFSAPQATTFATWTAARKEEQLDIPGITAARLPGWFEGAASWPSGAPGDLALVADLERRFPPIEDRRTSTRIGIGVASGADSVYLTRDPTLVEEDRLLPLAMARDTAGGTITWSGTYLVNPWRDGQLVDLREYPKLRAYLRKHEGVVRRRHVAERNPDRWHRTIDRVEPGLLERPKLVIPDLKAAIHPVLDQGQYYPHHNLYFVSSEGWDLEVLGGLLLSDVANLFVGTYCVKMRGGCYRFQAQYLRRIRLPLPDAIKAVDARRLARAFIQRDVEAATGVSARVYGVPELALRRGSVSRASA